MWIATQCEDFDPEGLVTGRLWWSPDEELYCYEFDDSFLISAILGKQLVFDSVVLTQKFYNLNSHGSWHGVNRYIWHDGTQYVCSSKFGGAIDEYEEAILDEDGEDTGETIKLGDTWWSCATRDGTYIPRGLDKDTRDSVTPVWRFTGWKSATGDMAGEYEPFAEDAAAPSGNQYFGFRILSPGNLVQKPSFVSGVEQTPTFTGGGMVVWHDGADWIMSAVNGVKNPATGYWLGPADDVVGGYSRVYTGDDEDPTPDDKTVVIDSWEIGDNTTKDIDLDYRFGQVGVWL